MSKVELRKWAKSERAKLDMESISEKLVRELKSPVEFKNAKNVMLFYPLKDEVNLLSLLKDSAKSFYLPKVCGKDLLCCPYQEDDELCVSCFNTKEPISEPTESKNIDLIIVPALACDKNNYRLGYGGGFYDRFLSGLSAYKIACIPKEFLVESVFPEEFDIKMDKIIIA